MPITIRLFGTDYRLCSLNLDRKRIEEASPSTLKRYINLSNMELGICRDKGLETFAYGIENVLKELHAQQRINSNRDSLEYGCICG